MPKLRYHVAQQMRWKIGQLLQEMSEFADDEEDAVEAGAKPDDMYIEALAEACLHLDKARIAMAAIE